jgi:hypothetical protein
MASAMKARHVLGPVAYTARHTDLQGSSSRHTAASALTHHLTLHEERERGGQREAGVGWVCGGWGGGE